MKRWYLLLFGVIISIWVYGNDQTMAVSINEVKKRHEARLIELPGVASVGIGRDQAGNPAIMIGLDGSHPEIESQLPLSLEGYPVIVKTIGPIKAQH